MLVPTAHNADVGVSRIEHQVARDGLIPGDGGAVAMLGMGPAAVADDVAAASDVIEDPIHKSRTV